MDNDGTGHGSKHEVDQAAALLERFLAEFESRRARAGLTYAEIANRMGVSRAYVSKIMTGKQNPTLITLARLAGALGCTVDLNLESKVVNSKVIIRKL